MSVMMEVESCIQCPAHRVVADPDPFDWFCDDDCAVLCTKSEKKPEQLGSGAYRCVEPMVTVGCRPYNLEKETPPPDWCPLRKT